APQKWVSPRAGCPVGLRSRRMLGRPPTPVWGPGTERGHGMGGGMGPGVSLERKGQYGGAGEINGGELQPQKGQGGGLGDGGQEAREARAETRPRAGWARLLQDPPGRRHKGLHKKGLGKGCFGLKLDRIGAMSGLGC
uniref:C-type natriuretic peptide n=1 Tax=Cairina moschata TaxID=8855 RepID=A0A8C3BAE1_CAIMO